MCTKGNCGTSRPYGTTTTLGGGGSAPATASDLAGGSGTMLSDLVNFGDLGTALTSAGIEKALGSTPTAYKSGLAVAVSVVSRMITRNFGGIVSLNGTITSPVTKDIFIVGLVNALVAWGMKRNVARAVAVGVAADLLSDRMLMMFGVNEQRGLFA